jgi:hypothetical protein
LSVAPSQGPGPVRLGARLAGWISGFAVAEAVVAVLIAVLLLLAFGLSPLNGDVMWALVWGKQLAHGVLPSYTTELASTPHPMATLLGAIFAVFGRDGAYTAMVLVGYLSYGFLLVGTFRLGRVAFSWPVGLVAAGAMATSLSILSFASIGYLDVTAAALAVWAATLESQRPRRGVPVLALLALAGLQRPEMWLLSGVYWIYLVPGLTPRARVSTAILAAAAPLVWTLGDLIVTGDPLFSFGFTHQAIAAAIEHQGGPPARSLGPFLDSLRSVLRLPGLLGGLAGLVLAVAARWRSSYATVALTVLSGLAVELQARAGLIILDRFMFVPAAGLAVLLGFACFGWLAAPSGLRARLWAAGGLVIFAVYCASASTHLRFQADSPDRLAAPERAREQVRALVRQPGARVILDRCGPVLASQVLTPYLVYYLGRPPGYVVARGGRGARSYVRPRNAAATAFSVADAFKPSLPGFREVARNASWAVMAGSCP